MKRACVLLAALVAGAAIAAGNTPVANDVQKSSPPGRTDLSVMHSGISTAGDLGEIKVPKATGAEARTVAEIVTGAAALDRKTVVVRAKVVKFTPEVMGKNWVHVRDGSGSAKDGSNDILVTTKDAAKVGDIIVLRGIVRTNVDIGSGYFYKVLVEDAALKR